MKAPLHKRRWVVALAAFAGVALLAGPAITPTFTALIEMPVTSVSQSDTPVTPDTLKPDGCIGPTLLVGVVSGAGPINGGGDAELVLGGAGDDVINAGPGDDCAIGGAGTDTIDGGDGYDVCIGNPATVFTNCEVTDPG